MSEVSLHTPNAGRIIGVAGVKGCDFTEMCCGTETGSYLRLTDSCITQLKAQGPSRTCDKSNEEGATSRRERLFFIDNLLVRIRYIIEMIWWNGLAP